MDGSVKKLLSLMTVLGIALLSSFANAAELQDVSVDRVDKRYVLRSETLFAVVPEDLYGVLTDYDVFNKFSSAISESRNLEPDEDGKPQFYNRMQGCVLLFCVSFERYGHLVLTPLTEIVAIVDPEKSDFKYGVERWQLIEDGEKTLLIYEFEIEPDFWVPPVIGPFYIRRVLRAGAINAVDRIEAIAQGREPEV